MSGLKCIESICIYGLTGAGKTTQAKEMARVIRKFVGEDKHMRLVSANADGWKVIQPAVDLGIVNPTWLLSRKEDRQWLYNRVTQGWWPLNPQDPESPLIPPHQQKDLAQVGGTFFDSGTDFADDMMSMGVKKEAASSTYRMSASEPAHKYSEGPKGDEDSFGAPGKAHYGVVQNRIGDFIKQSRNLPNQFIIWTFLEDRGKDPSRGTPIYGPDLPGQALGGKVPSWFGRTIRLSSHLTSDGNVRRMWLHNHYQQGDPVPYLANARDYIDAPLPLYFEDKEFEDKGKPAVTPATRTVSMYYFYQQLMKSAEKVKAMMGKEGK